jgi:Do/DeqQ family serine protease
MRTLHRLAVAALIAAAACSAPATTPSEASDFGLPAPNEGPALPEMAQANGGGGFVPQTKADLAPSLAPVVREASPAVVNVYALRRVRTIVADPFWGRFGRSFGVPQERVDRSLGSGVIVRADGVIVTNNHVVEGAEQLKIVLSDRREYDATIVTTDPRTDLAVLRIDPKGERLPALAFADTRQTQVGDFVIAIGNPFGLQQTVTSGIVSALARTDVGLNDSSIFIQTDAAINPGNSGGALVDMKGNLVGVNTAIFSRDGQSAGVGFAIPAEMVRRVTEGALAGGQIVRPWLGVRAQPVTQELARTLGLDRPRGVLVSELFRDGPGERAGLRRGDVVLSVNSVEVLDEAAMRYQAATQRPGVTFPVEIMRGSERRILQVRAEGPARTPAPDPRDLVGPQPLSGAKVVTLSPALAEESGLDPFVSGVMIQAIDRAGFAARAGFAPGDLILAINGRNVRTSGELDQAVRAGAVNGTWRIVMERGGKRQEVAFRG